MLMNIYKTFPRRTRLRRVWRPSIIETTLYDRFFWAIFYVETVMFIKIHLMDSIITFNKRFATYITTIIKIYSTFRFKHITIAKKIISSIHIIGCPITIPTPSVNFKRFRVVKKVLARVIRVSYSVFDIELPIDL